MKLKLDLHTHCMEATKVVNPSEESVAEILDVMRARGLDGIAVTEHHDEMYGRKVKEIVDNYFGGEFLIIPGQEIDEERVQVIELYLPDGVTFRFLAHPGYPYPGEYPSDALMRTLHGIELENRLHFGELDASKITALAEEYDLIMLRNSDAHAVRNIGIYYNEIDLRKLSKRARRKT